MEQRYPHYKNSLSDLRAALENLKSFALENESSSIPHIHNLRIDNGEITAKRNSKLQKTIDLTRCFISALFSDKSRLEQDKQRNEIEEELLRSIDWLKTHYWMIEKFKKGTPQQQELARLAVNTINRYNCVMQTQSSPSWRQKITQFFYAFSGVSVGKKLKNHTITLPLKASIHYESSPVSKASAKALLSSSSKKIATLITPKGSHNFAPTTQELDAFRMKAITLIKNYGFPHAIRDALQSMRHTPINSSHSDPEKPQSVVSFSQTITSLPGEIIELNGSFQRNARAKTPSIPIPESFHVSSRSTQTGFPHPSQYHGWALAEVLIPSCPHQLDLLPLHQAMYQQKRHIAHELLPEGSLNKKAKQLIELKKQAFEVNLDLFANLHATLSKSLIAAAYGKQALPSRVEQVIDHYYTLLTKNSSPYAYLSQTHHFISENFILYPFDRLHEEWLELGNPKMVHDDREKRSQACLDILDRELNLVYQNVLTQLRQTTSEEENASLAYIAMQGRLISLACRPLILQQLSEKLEFAPPILNVFEQLLQTSIYQQLLSFWEELETDWNLSEEKESLKKMKHRLKNLLEKDITLFQTQECEQTMSFQYVQELEEYYFMRCK